MKIANSDADSKVVAWVKEILLGRAQRVGVGVQLSEEVRVISGVSQGSSLGSLPFLTYVNDIWRNILSTIRLFADDCIMYRKITMKTLKSCRKIWTGWGSGRLKAR